jgi:hypothetical protein
MDSNPEVWTAEELKPLVYYIDKMRTFCRMQNWDVCIHPQKIAIDEDTWASTWHDRNHEVLNVRFSEDFLRAAPREIQNSVLHELVHAQHRNVSELWDDCTTGNSALAVDETQVWDRDMATHMERFVSWITRTMCSTGKVPAWTGKASGPAPEGIWIKERERE